MEATLGNNSPRRQVVRQLSLVFSGLLLLALALGLVSLYRIAQALDERERVQSHFHAEAALAQMHKNERSYLVAYAVWQAAYDHLARRVDRHWAYDEDNVGATLYSDDGYQGVFVLDDDGTHYAMLEGRLSEEGFDRHSGSSAQVLQQARQAVQQQQAASGYLLYNGQPALFAAAVIRPPSVPQPLPAAGAVLVFVRVMNPTMLNQLGQAAGLPGFAVIPASQLPTGKGHLPLGETGYALTWPIEQPGTELFHTVFMPLAFAWLIIAMVMALCARYALRASAGIDRSHRELAASKFALEASEARFKAVAEAASDWIWEADAQQHLTYLSPRFTELTGHTLERWLQRPISDLFDCETGQVETWLHGLAGSEATGSLRCQYHDRLEQRRECRIAARAIIAQKTCQGYRGTCTDITDEVAAHAHIQHLSLHDALTGLPNRNKLFRYLEEARHGDLALLMLDLDNFKPINDSLGHPAGDAVLVEVAHRLGQVTRDTDLVARLGGDEFVIVLSRPGKHDEVDRFCARLIETLKRPITFEQHKVQVGGSLGVVLSAEYPGPPGDLIRYADVALYSAKQAGKHTWRYFSAQLNTALLEKRELERELREGIPRGELRLHFQPRFKVDGVTLASAEALVRWQHPRLGLLRPDRFIALAEESDLIVQLGNWVIHEACTLARGWPLEVMVSVNMSPAQFSRSDVVRDVAEALRHTGLPAHRLELEITENVMLNDVEGALQTMNALKELGVRLNMDDFGTGYSSLGYLRTYPFDSIKIDKRFVQSLGTSNSDRSVVQAIINLGNAMGMTVTAEGVETAEQLALLSDDQCHEVQGYLLSRPVENRVLVRLMEPGEPEPGGMS
ncbi:EAL domain-containing protein [Pseudomonas sp. Leaf58]|uniref:bifunctional diguanylate cyclase/phosphodiesterase n=1 Tax=Pseudomonas sp. Leaf58 TaxID=1736226 RepID=UPI0006F4109C|nr:EAL domain-containing protein [Pseudomonas sp. Leaf58]AYG44709.1 EAL domain-containing protein [Pseudomonas sp. Leaf58]KQN61383.1 histidine kinase [Pseudomonas sp. Leaf58]